MAVYNVFQSWAGRAVGVIYAWGGDLYAGVEAEAGFGAEIWQYTAGAWNLRHTHTILGGNFLGAFTLLDVIGEWGLPDTEYLVFVGGSGQVAYSSNGVNWTESNPEDEGIEISSFQSGFDDAVNDPGVPYIGDTWDPGNLFPAGDGVNQMAGIWGVYNMGEGGPGGGIGYTLTRYAEKVWTLGHPWVQLFGGANGGTIWERTDVMPDAWTRRFAGFDPNNDSREGGVVQVFPAAGLLLAGSNGGVPNPEAKLYYWPAAGNMDCRYTAPNDTYIAGFAYDGINLWSATGIIDKNVLISEDGGWTWQVDGTMADAPPLGQPIACVGGEVYVAGADKIYQRSVAPPPAPAGGAGWPYHDWAGD